MRPQYIMFFAWTLLGGNLFCAIIDGTWLGAEDATLMGYLTGMTNLQTASWTAIFTIPYNFFTHGLPKLLMWDFSFLATGVGLYIRWFLFILTIGAIWAIAQEFRSAVQGLFTRR